MPHYPADITIAFNYYFELYRKFHSQHLHLKEQEYILVTMGHLKLQKHSRLVRSWVISAFFTFRYILLYCGKRLLHICLQYIPPFTLILTQSDKISRVLALLLYYATFLKYSYFVYIYPKQSHSLLHDHC